jgi:predicted RNase H-like HicB family nuclease
LIFWGIKDKIRAVRRRLKMKRNFMLEYWLDDGWYVGRLKDVPGIFSQGETLEELKENVLDAYNLMLEDEHIDIHGESKQVAIEVEV